MSNTYFVLRESDNAIVNVVLWDGVSSWAPDEGEYVLPFEEGIGIGWAKINEEWVDMRPPKPEPTETEE